MSKTTKKKSVPKGPAIKGPLVGYTDIIDHAMREQSKENPWNGFPLRPSASGACTRKLGYDLMQYLGHEKYETEARPPNVQRLLSLGNSVEWHSIRNFQMVKPFKIRFKQQSVTMFRLNDGTLIEGSIDFALFVDDFKAIVDVKSVKDNWSNGYKSKWDESTDKFSQMKSLVNVTPTSWYAPDLEAFLKELREPFFEDNFIQLNTYCCTQWAKDHDIDHGVIYRYNKNDSRHLEIRFKPSMKMYKAVKEKFDTVAKAIAKKNPESLRCDFLPGSIKCAFCPYKDKCWPDIDNKKEYFKTFPKKKWPKDTDRMGPSGVKLEELFDIYHGDAIQATAATETEEDIIKIMLEQRELKIKLPDGRVYIAKHLKSPRPHYEIRRSKL